MAQKRADIRHIKAMNSLHPVFAASVRKVLRDLELKGWQPVLVYGARTEKQQAELHKKGVGAKHSWHVPTTQKKLKKKGDKTHYRVRGCAADIIDRRWAWSGPCSNKNHQFWKDLGKIAKKHGLGWGGDWKKRDVAHVQIKIIEDRAISTDIA